MKKIGAAIVLAILTVLGCLLVPLSAGASTIVLTVVNDEILPLSAATMPTRISGEWYVPYVVFRSFDIAAAEQEEGDVLVIQNENTTLTFSVSQGYVYDQNMNSFSQPAYAVNDTIYVPVKLMCSQFDLYFSQISGENQILRICDDNATLSDRAFVTKSSDTAEDIVDQYKGTNTPNQPQQPQTPETPADNNAPEPVPPEKPIQRAPIRPNLIYLAFYGAPNEYSADLLDTLQTYNRSATFFLPLAEEWDADFVRRLTAEGHTVGLLLPEGQKSPAEALQQANERLFAIAGVQTRMVSTDGKWTLSDDQKAQIEQAGFRVWTASVTADDDVRTASQVAAWILRSFDGTTATSAMAMHHAKSTNAALTMILRDLRVNQVRTQTVTEADALIA